MEFIQLAVPVGGHAGGDAHLLTDFVRLVRDKQGLGRSSIKDSFESHYMAFAAEHSRLNKGVHVDVQNYKRVGKGW
jgi:hypothetical protein